MIPQDKIIEWARKAGFFVSTELRDVDPRFQNFANLVAQYQKEGAVRMCEQLQDALDRHKWPKGYRRAAAIRNQE